MNEFVEECRREWKRRGVPDPVANEMAADLAADLEEAEAEGATAEDVLGSGAFDPQSFANDWATERGVVQRPPPSGHRPRIALRAAAITASALIAIIGAVLMMLASPSGGPLRLAFNGPLSTRPAIGPQTIVLTAARPAPVVWTTVSGRVFTVDVPESGVDARRVGLILLILGLAGTVPLTLFWLWSARGRQPRIDPA